MTAPSGSRAPVLAEAWETRTGDVLDGHPVATSTTSGDQVTVTFEDGAPSRTMQRTAEVRLHRWFGAPA